MSINEKLWAIHQMENWPLDEKIAAYYEVTKYLSEVTTLKEKLRESILEESVGEEAFVESKIVNLPQGFLEARGLSPEEFVESRFPGWNIISTSENDEEASFLLEQDPKYANWKHEGSGYIVSKSVSNVVPKVDWDSMKMENPKLMKKLSKVQEVRVLDDDKFIQHIEEYPEDLAIIERHLIGRKPVVKVSVKESKVEEEID